jgi:Kef-type K+ transport system membrane component KefB
MADNAQLILAIGVLLLLGMGAHLLGQRTFLPRVSLLVISGVAIGPTGLDLIPAVLVGSFELVATMALLMIGFLLGGKLTRQSLMHSRNNSIVISLSSAVGTAVIVFGGLLLLGTPAEIALLLGCIASATAPAATIDIVDEFGSRSTFSDLLLLVVALDDIWGLILFSFALAAVGVMQGLDGTTAPLLIVTREIGGGALIGLLIGLPAAYMTGRIKPGQPILTEALGLVFVCAGLALWTDASFLIASMVMGATIANLAQHHEYPFHAIEDIESPFLIVFFVLAGASLELDAPAAAGLLGVVYIVSRVIGKFVGTAAGARISHADTLTTRWMGLALLPQAGIAVGMALVASSAFPEYRSVLLPIVIGATVIFEILGPFGTRFALTATKD